MFDSSQHLRDHAARLQAQRADLAAVEDPELRPLVEEEIRALDIQLEEIENTIKKMSAGNATGHNFTNCIVEIRSGAGGDEAKLWAEELMMMYTRYADLKKFKIEAMDLGVIKIIGKTAYETLRFESGVHRVQRVPATESQGRIHTSTASVAVIPEVPESEVEIREDDLEWQFSRAGGAGGQNVNKVNTAVLLRHIPSGLMVTSRQERSQQQNRVIALTLLRAQLWEIQEEERLKQLGDARKAIGRAQRAEKIRTYNFPQNRLTDHRIPQSWYDLDRRLMGDLDDVIEALKTWETDPEGYSSGQEDVE